MVFVAGLIASKMSNHAGIEHFKNSMVLNTNKKIEYKDYYNSVMNSSLNFIFLCIVLIINIIPALLIAYHCTKNSTNKIFNMIIAILFSDFYIFYYAIRRFVYKDERFCN